MKKKKPSENTIALNKQAGFNYFLETTFQAGIALYGWEVKSIRAGKLQLKESHIIAKDNEIFLVNAHVSALNTISSHTHANPTRTRKLLLNKKEINRLSTGSQTQGYTLVAVSAYWKNGLVKLKIALAKGKKLYDKRDTIKDKEWSLKKDRIVKQHRLKNS